MNYFSEKGTSTNGCNIELKTENIFCNTCLAENRILRTYSQNSIFYRSIFSDFTTDLNSVSICWECERVLKKFLDFKNQARIALNTFQHSSEFQTLSHLKTTTPSVLEIYKGDTKKRLKIAKKAKKTERKIQKFDIDLDIVKTEEDFEDKIESEDEFLNKLGTTPHSKPTQPDKLNTGKRKEGDKIILKKKARTKQLQNKSQLENPTDLSETYCAKCDKYFKNSYTFKMHFKISKAHVSSSERRFECKDCGKKYLNNFILKEHQNREHLKIARFPCDRCEQKFLTQKHLSRHKKRTHDYKTTPRDKICHICGRGFSSSQILKRHTYTHTGERPFTCQYCPATFTQGTSRLNHTKLVHLKLRRKIEGNKVVWEPKQPKKYSSFTPC